MRWLFVALGGLVLIFVLVMLLAPGGGGGVPGWIRGGGAALMRFAPRVETFADGGRVIEFSGSGEQSRPIASDPDQAWRILTLRLASGEGPVRVIHRCNPLPGNDACDGEDQVLCLGARHSDCEQEEIGATGAFAISAGGGALRVIAPGRAMVRIDD